MSLRLFTFFLYFSIYGADDCRLDAQSRAIASMEVLMQKQRLRLGAAEEKNGVDVAAPHGNRFVLRKINHQSNASIFLFLLKQECMVTDLRS